MNNSVLNKDSETIAQKADAWRDLFDKSILITGATGLVGSMLVRSLLAINDKYNAGIRVYAQGRSKEKAELLFGEALSRSDLVLLYSEDLRLDIPCDYIIHGASPTASRFFVEHPVETLDTSVFGTKQMLELARKNQIQGMVYLSSMEEYGTPYQAGEIYSEDCVGIVDHMQIRSCYPTGKRACECYCASYAFEYDVPVTIARLAQTFGAGVSLTDQRVFMQFAGSVIHKTDIVLHTEGKSMSNFCYLADAVTAILLLLVRGKRGEAYNVCHDEETRTIADIAHLVADDIAGGKIQVKFDIPDTNQYGYAKDVALRLSSEKIRALGWKPETDMKDAYTRLIAYLREEMS